MTDYKPRPNWLDMQKVEALRRGAWLGAGVGCIVGLGLMMIVHVALASYSNSKHEAAIASIREADRILMAECQSIVEDVAEEKYETVRDLKRQIEDLRR